MGSCLAKPKNEGDDSVNNVEFAGGNVHLITTKESWDQKLSEARRDGKSCCEKRYLYGHNHERLVTKLKDLRKGPYIALLGGKRFICLVIANFSASWCGPCRMIAPFYCELSEKYPTLIFLTIDVDELTEFSTSWDIKATPTFFFVKDGQQIDKLVGANKPELQKKIISIVDSETSLQK